MINKKIDLIEQHFSDFAQNIANLLNLIHTIKKSSDDTIKKLDESKINIDKFISNPNNDDELKKYLGVSFRHFSLINPYTGARESLTHRQTDILEQKRLSLNLKNKQYQWVFTDAYELFENYIQIMYCCAGFIDGSFWPEKEYSKISAHDIDEKGLSCFMEQVERKNDKPKSILKEFRKKIKGYADIECKNKARGSYTFIIPLIARFRHIIVHEGGCFNDKEKFVKDLFDKENITKKDRKDARSIIELFAAEVNGKDTIMLLERPYGFGIAATYMHLNRAELLINIILEYSVIIKTELKDHFLEKYKDRINPTMG